MLPNTHLFADWVSEMRFVTLFFNAMRLSSRIDCRQFAIDPAYHQTVERELCAGVAPRGVDRAAAENTAGESVWRTA